MEKKFLVYGHGYSLRRRVKFTAILPPKPFMAEKASVHLWERRVENILRTLLATSSVFQTPKFVCGLGQSRAVVTVQVWGPIWTFISKAVVTTALQDSWLFMWQSVCEGSRLACSCQGGDPILSVVWNAPGRVKGLYLILMGRSSCAYGVGQCGDCNLAEMWANDSPHCLYVRQ